MSTNTSPQGYQPEPDTRPAAHIIAPWIMHAASLGVAITITTALGQQITGVVEQVLTARASGAPRDDTWVRFGIDGHIVSAGDITSVQQADAR